MKNHFVFIVTGNADKKTGLANDFDRPVKCLTCYFAVLPRLLAVITAVLPGCIAVSISIKLF